MKDNQRKAMFANMDRQDPTRKTTRAFKSFKGVLPVGAPKKFSKAELKKETLEINRRLKKQGRNFRVIVR